MPEPTRRRRTDAGLAALAPLSKLEYLNLYGTNVTDAGLASLRPLVSLQRLYVWQSKVTATAATAFADARVDPARTRELQQQIAALQALIAQQHVAVVGTTTRSATRPTTSTATATAKQ